MKIAIALQVQKAIAEEIAHRRRMEQEKSWSYVTRDTPNTETRPNFDFDANHELIKKLTKLHTRLGKAIARTNLEVDILGINDIDYADWA